MITKFDANYGTRHRDTVRQQFEAPLRTTAYLDYSPSLCDSNLIKEPGRFLGELRSLLLQAFLLCEAVPFSVRRIVSVFKSY